ncbi:dihydropyrimidinase [Sinanaerobacter chloroacetimidivorans]|uniref:Dihydropyrimidinase n=1 Tax=Sinanaerobacter chloroacetimidivorans TaxID=2818044 RepID=A0A8J8B223_9FIRM|nr:dihydropyrimidinase [Sinanaerobacter chloroacetimidivorans]MBR0598839.1 dihydropyrimidinase [Sinanaerobacter chloroacetimidivorans]
MQRRKKRRVLQLDLLIKNGTIVTADSTIKADLAVKDGKIMAIGQNLKPEKGTEVVDAKGKLVLPGAIDGHTHLAMPFGGTISTDDYYAGTRSAACGGTTTVFDFVLQGKGETMVDAIKRRDAIAAPDVAVDYSFHVGVCDVTTPELLDSMEDAVKYGVPSFKVFMVYDFGVDDGSFYQVLQKAAKIGALVGVHAENRDVNNVLVKQYLAEGKTDAWWHYMAKNEDVEGEADVRAINLAKMAGTSLYIVHLANKQGVEAVTKARDEGYPIFAETCPQYLYFTNEVYKRERGRDFVCSPPMKGKESQDAIWAGIKRGDIATVATDHCPFTQAEKDWGITTKDGKPGNFTTIPNGCAGIENMYPYMLSEANKGRISFNKAVELCATNPSKLFGLDHVKGDLLPGLDADIVIYDPKKNFTITNDAMHGDTDHTIWEGAKLKGYPVATYSRGNLVYKDGEFLGKKGDGKFIKCKPLKFTGPCL